MCVSHSLCAQDKSEKKEKKRELSPAANGAEESAEKKKVSEAWGLCLSVCVWITCVRRSPWVACPVQSPARPQPCAGGPLATLAAS